MKSQGLFGGLEAREGGGRGGGRRGGSAALSSFVWEHRARRSPPAPWGGGTAVGAAPLLLMGVGIGAGTAAERARVALPAERDPDDAASISLSPAREPFGLSAGRCLSPSRGERGSVVLK